MTSGETPWWDSDEVNAAEEEVADAVYLSSPEVPEIDPRIRQIFHEVMEEVTTPTRGESANGGESADRERARLAQRLEARGHGGCAYDLEAADDHEVTAVAYSIVEHLRMGCGAPRESDQHIADDLEEWADAVEDLHSGHVIQSCDKENQMSLFGKCPRSGDGGVHRRCTDPNCGHYRGRLRRMRHCFCGARY